MHYSDNIEVEAVNGIEPANKCNKCGGIAAGLIRMGINEWVYCAKCLSVIHTL